MVNLLAWVGALTIVGVSTIWAVVITLALYNLEKRHEALRERVREIAEKMKIC